MNKKILFRSLIFMFKCFSIFLFVFGCHNPASVSSEKTILTYKFSASENTALSNDITGTIDGTTISVTVPYGTNITSLIATFTTTGTRVAVGSTTQTSGSTTNNFTNSLTYTVIAEDGSSQNYTVLVNVAANTAKEITAFSFSASKNSELSNNVTATINGTTISATVPYGTNVTALVATFTTTGTRVFVGSTTQTSGSTANNFTTSLIYKVTAEDGSSQNYSVQVTVAANTAKEITAFSFSAAANSELSSDVTATISGTSITATVPNGTSRTALVATFSTTGTNVKVGSETQASGSTPNNFTSSLTYTVTAENGSTQEYSVIVSEASAPLSSSKDITFFVFLSDDNPALSDNYSALIPSVFPVINITLPSGTDASSLKAAFETTGISVQVVTGSGTVNQVSRETPNDFSNGAVTYQVTAEDGSTKEYIVNVTIDYAVGEQKVYSADGVSFAMRFVPACSSFPITTYDNYTCEDITRSFWMGETEVTYELWQKVYTWAVSHGYVFLNSGMAGHDGLQGDQHPVTSVSWRDCLVWCNALTEWFSIKNGASLGCVYVQSGTDIPCRNANLNDGWEMNNYATGFRLPTGYEWELAGRYRGSDSTNTVAGFSNPYFTKGNSLSGATVSWNDYSDGLGEPAKSINDALSVYGEYWNGSEWLPTGVTGTATVGSKNPNALNLYNMNGNVREWQYSIYSSGNGNFYFRGGSWSEDPDPIGLSATTTNSYMVENNIGFRIAKNK